MPKPDRNRELFLGQIIEIARGLKSDDGENVEYDRALIELVCEAAGLPLGDTENRNAVADALGIMHDFDANS